jgi:antitoxin YefM
MVREFYLNTKGAYWKSKLLYVRYVCTIRKVIKMSISLTYTQARANLAKLLDDVSLNKEVVIINRKNAENVALISESELSGILETAHLLRSPKNAQRLLTALLKVNEKNQTPQTLEELKREFGLEK